MHNVAQTDLQHPYPSAVHARLNTELLLLARLPVADIAVHNLVQLALLSELAGRLDLGFGTVLLEVVVRHDFTADKLVFEVRATRSAVFPVCGPSRYVPLVRQQKRADILDNTSSSRRLDALPDSPRPHLVRPTCKVPDQVQRLVARSCNLAQCRGITLGQTQSLALGRLFIIAHRD